MLDASKVKKGTTAIKFQGREFVPVACWDHTEQSFHDQSNCPACKDPQASPITGRGPGHIENQLLPTSDKLSGFQPTCPGCAETVKNTVEHINRLDQEGMVDHT